MNAHRTAAMVAATALLGILPSGRLAAQMTTEFGSRSLSLTVSAGPSMPINQLSRITDTGAAIGADVAYGLTNRLAVTLDGDVDALTGHESIEPDMRLWHYGGGLQVDVTPRQSPFSIMLAGGANATTIDTSPIGIDSNTDFTHTYFGLNGGLELGYDVSKNVDFAVRGSSYFVFANKTQTAVLTNGTGAQPLATAVTIPVTAELHIALPNI